MTKTRIGRLAFRFLDALSTPRGETISYFCVLVITLLLMLAGAVADDNALTATGLTFLIGYGFGYVVGYARGVRTERTEEQTEDSQ